MRRQRRGSAALEFGLVWPAWMGFFLGTIDSSMMLWQRMSIEWAAERGCRAGAMIDPGSDWSAWAEVQEATQIGVTNALIGYGVDPNDAVVLAEVDTSPETGISSLTCTVTRNSTTVVGLIPELTMEVTVLNRMEFQR